MQQHIAQNLVADKSVAGCGHQCRDLLPLTIDVSAQSEHAFGDFDGRIKLSLLTVSPPTQARDPCNFPNTLDMRQQRTDADARLKHTLGFSLSGLKLLESDFVLGKQRIHFGQADSSTILEPPSMQLVKLFLPRPDDRRSQSACGIRKAGLNIRREFVQGIQIQRRSVVVRGWHFCIVCQIERSVGRFDEPFRK